MPRLVKTKQVFCDLCGCLRMATTDPVTRMPNLATRLVDAEGTELVRRWIAELGGCDE